MYEEITQFLRMFDLRKSKEEEELYCGTYFIDVNIPIY